MKVRKKRVIGIDVGGTYCDGYTEWEGQGTSLKILSSGVLRARVVNQLSEVKLQIEQPWALPYPDVLKNCFISLKDKTLGSILSFDPLSNVLSLSKKVNVPPGSSIDLSMGAEAPIFMAHLLSGIPVIQKLKDITLNIGTTKTTNALLELKGQPAVVIINRGLKDLLFIKTQQRPDLFQINIPNPSIYYSKVIEVNCRIDQHGHTIQSLGLKELNFILSQLPKDTSTPIAVVLMHSYKFPAQERKIKSFLSNHGYTFLSISSDLHPAIQIVPRAETTCINAYLLPVLKKFQDNLKKNISSKNLNFETSAGQLQPSNSFLPKDSLLSGPAGGLKAAEFIGKQYNLAKLITFDMGGTSTDTARVHKKGELKFQTKIKDITLANAAYHIETVAAGGGSIVAYQDGKIMVGPSSAGADPGPACYGKNGPLTLTDINLLMGRLDISQFNIPIDVQAAQVKMDALLKKAGIKKTNVLALMEGILQIANEKMAEAIRKISHQEGYDAADHNLLVFGGAGGLHACGVSDVLGIRSILIPKQAGVLSAKGIYHTQEETISIKQILKTYTTHLNYEINASFQTLLLKNKKFDQNTHQAEQVVYLRFKGQSQVLELKWLNGHKLTKRFKELYQQKFGFTPDTDLEVEKILIRISQPTTQVKNNLLTQSPQVPLKGHIFWNHLQKGNVIESGSIIYSNQSTVFLAPGWQAIVQANNDLLLQRISNVSMPTVHHQAIQLELNTNRLKMIAEQMGSFLQFSATSVNIKERLDFSCGILDDKARLIVNAPHIPVHLGSLGVCARLILKDFKIASGDVIICNHPLYGGSHLPDITLIKGVYNSNKLIGYVINRAHHAEIGGLTPGSMPPMAKNLEEEGVVIPPTYLYKSGIPQWSEIEYLLSGANYPSRHPRLNRLDIQAAVESLLVGEKRILELCGTLGGAYVQSYMHKIFDQASSEINNFIRSHSNKNFEAIEYLDDGRKIKVHIHVKNERLIIDFTGTDAGMYRNLNANQSITYSAILYVLRLMCIKDIPLNEGLMKKVQVVLPRCLLNPHFVMDAAMCPPVVGGNTEVSQRLTDTLIKAFHLSACSQGTMNNFLFGNESFSYYETIGGGTGATAQAPGRSAVHSHMTNTKITDPEELEFNYPVLLEEFSIRRGSGGRGRHRGGDGIIRQIKFLSPVVATFIGEHRLVSPFGFKGGDPGKVGRQHVLDKNGKKHNLLQNQSISINPGESIRIKTPGGGGYGKHIK